MNNDKQENEVRISECVKDYLSELCKDDNKDVNKYLSEVNTTKKVELRDSMLNEMIRSYKAVTHEKHIMRPKMTYTFWDRLCTLWLALRGTFDHYNPFDFKSYPMYENYEMVGNLKENPIPQFSTPWMRFKNKVKNSIAEIKWAWNYYPEHLKHYKKNKNRIGTFENSQDKLFTDKQTQDLMRQLGYIVKPNQVYYDQNFTQEKI